MSGPEFFDPFPVTPKKVNEEKVVSITGSPVHKDEPLDFEGLAAEYIKEAQEEGEVTRVIVILDGPGTGLRIRYMGDLDVSAAVGQLQMAAFVVMHEAMLEDD